LPAGEQLAHIMLDATEPASTERDRLLLNGPRIGWDRVHHLYTTTIGDTKYSFQFFNDRCFVDVGRA
jgi:hypothetical protein